MDLDNLIFILIFLAVVISNIKKIITENRKKKGAEKPAKTEKTDFLQKLVEKFVSRIQEEITPRARETRQREAVQDRLSGWDAIIDEEDTLEKPYGDQDEKEDKDDYVPLELEENESEIVAALPISESPETVSEKNLELKLESESNEKRGIEEYSEPRKYSYPVRELQKAVIWAEILAPPVALRE
jgi:hypothetical protein